MEPVQYIEKTRQYYLSQGYDKPYQWAHHDNAPFAPLKKPLAQSRFALVSTGEIAIRFDPETTTDPLENGQVGSVYSIPTDTPLELLYSRTHSFDDFATHMDDVNTYFPVTRLQEMVETGRIGSLSPRIHGVYNAYSQRKTIETDAPEVLKRCREDGVDVAVLVPV